jgi:Ca2+-binding RTX toxin-like protein
MTYTSTTAPGSIIDLDDWKVQLPVDSSGGFSGSYTEVWNLDTYVSPYFYTGSDGALVLTAPVEGVTTGGSSYARTELREVDGSSNAEWTLDQGGYLAVAMQVDMVPQKTDGSDAKIVIGQIHGGDSQLVRLYFEHGSIYWVNGRNEAQAKDVIYQLKDSKGNTPDVDLNETFSYSFNVKGHDLSVSVTADGTTYFSKITIGPGWDDNQFYFKAGLYLGTNESTSTGDGQVSIFDTVLTHDGSHPGLTVPGTSVPKPVPVSDVISDGGVVATLSGTTGDDVFSVSQEGTTVRGGSGFDTVRASSDWTMSTDVERLELVGSASIDGSGTTSNDVIVGNAAENYLKGNSGNDDLTGLGGNDRLSGSSGDDKLDGGAGDDSVSGSSGLDNLFGGAGADVLTGGGDVDVLTGGDGDDIFRFCSVSSSRAGKADTVTDFISGHDVIDLQQIDANTVLSGEQAFEWNGSGAGRLVLIGGVLSGDVDGDGRFDIQIDLGSSSIGHSDIFL